MEKGSGMGKIGKTYRREAWAPAEAVQRFDRELTDPQAREMRSQLVGSLVLVLFVIGVIGWAFTL